MYIANPDVTADDIAGLNEGITKVFTEQGGTVVKVDDWGKKNLAYKINKKSVGHYVLLELEGTGRELLELERRMRVNDLIMRFVTVRVDEDRKAAEKVKAKKERRNSRKAKFKPTENNVETVETEKEESN
jgi:small subunit ribosomal protein S6